MTVFTLGACVGFLKPDGNSDHTNTLATSTFLFMAAYSIGIGPVPLTTSSEVFPHEHRMVGLSLSVFVNLSGAGVLALIVGAFGVLTGMNVLAFCFVLLFIRETAATSGDKAISWKS